MTLSFALYIFGFSFPGQFTLDIAGPGAQADAHWMRQLAKSRALPADEANHDLLPTPPGSPAEANVNTAMGEHEAGRQDLVGERVCNDPAFAGAQVLTFTCTVHLVCRHSFRTPFESCSKNMDSAQQTNASQRLDCLLPMSCAHVGACR